MERRSPTESDVQSVEKRQQEPHRGDGADLEVPWKPEDTAQTGGHADVGNTRRALTSKRPRLDPQPSIEAASTLSDTTSIPFQLLKDIFMSPSASTSPALRQEWMQNINAALRRVEQEGTRSQETQALLANLASIASVRSSESVRTSEEPAMHMQSRGSPRKGSELSKSRIGREPWLPRIQSEGPWVRSGARLPETRSLQPPGAFEHMRTSVSEPFSIQLPSQSMKAPVLRSGSDSPRRPEKFRVYSNAFQQGGASAVRKTQVVSPGYKDTRRVAGLNANHDFGPLASETWAPKPEKVAVVTRSQAPRAELPKAASTGGSLKSVAQKQAHGPSRHASAPDLPPACSSSMGMSGAGVQARSGTGPIFSSREDMAASKLENELWMQNRKEAQQRLDKLEALTERRMKERESAAEKEARLVRRTSHVKSLPSEASLAQQDSLRARESQISSGMSHYDVSRASHSPYASLVSQQMMMDQMAAQWMQHYYTAAQAGALPPGALSPLAAMSKPLESGSLNPFIQRQLMMPPPGQHSGMFGGPPGGLQPKDSAGHVPWEDLPKGFRGNPGASALPTIMAMSSVEAIRQKAARDSILASQLGPQPLHDMYEHQALAMSQAEYARSSNNLLPAITMAMKTQDMEGLARQLQESRLRSLDGSFPGAALQAARAMQPLPPSRHETLVKPTAAHSRVTGAGRPSLHHDKDERTPLSIEEQVDINNPFAVVRERSGGFNTENQLKRAWTEETPEQAGRQAAPIRGAGPQMRSHNAKSAGQKSHISGSEGDRTRSSRSRTTNSDDIGAKSEEEEEQAAEILLSLVGLQPSAEEGSLETGLPQPMRRPRTKRARVSKPASKSQPSSWKE